MHSLVIWVNGRQKMVNEMWNKIRIRFCGLFFLSVLFLRFLYFLFLSSKQVGDTGFKPKEIAKQRK